jgi:hypothetical protein
MVHAMPVGATCFPPSGKSRLGPSPPQAYLCPPLERVIQNRGLPIVTRPHRPLGHAPIGESHYR